MPADDYNVVLRASHLVYADDGPLFVPFELRAYGLVDDSPVLTLKTVCGLCHTVVTTHVIDVSKLSGDLMHNIADAYSASDADEDIAHARTVHGGH